MTDLVYVLGSGSQWRNNELRYSLRSVEKHLEDYSKIIVIGDNPGFLDRKHVHYINYRESYTKAVNITLKVLEACQSNQVSENFLLMSDDIIFLTDFSADNYPVYHTGELPERHIQLRNQLESQKLSTLAYAVHTPMRINKTRMIKALSQFDWFNNEYCPKVLYGNACALPAEWIIDSKIWKPHTYEELKTAFERMNFFSLGDRAINKPMINILNELFPNPSRYESA